MASLLRTSLLLLSATLGLVSTGCKKMPERESETLFRTHREVLTPPTSEARIWTLLGGHPTVLTPEASTGWAVWQQVATSGTWVELAKSPPGLDAQRLLWSTHGSFIPSLTSHQSASWMGLSTSNKPEFASLPRLPTALTPTAVASHRGIIYLATAPSPHSSARLYSCDLSKPETWVDRGAVGSAGETVTHLTFQNNGERPHLYVLIRGETTATFSAYEPERGTWRQLPPPPFSPDRAALAPIGIAHLHAFVSGESTVENSLYVFNTVTRVWTTPYPLPKSGSFLAAGGSGTRLQGLALSSDDKVTWLTADYLKRAEGLHLADYAVIVVFLGGLVTMGVFNATRVRSADSYFRGGKRIPWLAAGLSVVATGQSATSFISLPARAFATNLQFALVPLTNVFGALIMSRYFVRFFIRLNITSAYEYLQIRFSPGVRTLGSINYLAYELARISLLILVPAVAVSAVTKIEITTAIMLMGAIATLYTTLGGLEGVVWADVVQILIKIAAILLVVVLIFAQLEGSLWELAGTAWREGKLRAVDWSFDLTRDTIWALLLFWFTDGLKSYVANQTIIQRFISTRDERTAQRSIRASALVGTLIFWTFMLAGTGLFLFYQQNPGRLDLTMDKPDAVFPWFIVFELSPGIAGFLITALITAALSSLYGALNSTSTVMVSDFYRRFARNPTDAGALKLGRRLTIFVGVAATGLSLVLAGLASRSLVEQTLSVVGLFGGGLGGLFLVGMLTTRVGTRAALTGFIMSAIVQYVVSRHTPLHWLTYMFTGMGSCFVIAWLSSFIWPETKPLNGLTVHTCSR